jgi:hypothetical protein
MQEVFSAGGKVYDSWPSPGDNVLGMSQNVAQLLKIL